MADLSAIDELLVRARSGLDRVQPEHLGEEIASGALIIDIRPADQRQRDGVLPSAILIDRNVLE
ncbi:MAG TPA: sulfurtransferase, partial [Nocardioidaceae bacterium]|nr:sulfurtransferase [Nocardioidaceae bacterium]